jgi:hypothetical protein
MVILGWVGGDNFTFHVKVEGVCLFPIGLSFK